MADYFPLLSKAVGGLDPNTPDARQAIYDRARAALTRQMSTMEPPVAPEIVTRELNALDDVVRRIEAAQPDARLAASALAEEPIASQLPADVRDTARSDPALSAPLTTPTRPQVTRRKEGKNRKPLIVAGLSLGLVAVTAIATLAFLRRNEPPAVAQRPGQASQAPAAQPPSPPAKTNDRITPGSPETPSQTPAPASQPSLPSQAPTTTAAPPQASPTVIAVANRMTLVLEGKEDPAKVDVRQGSVVWRTESVSGGQGQPLELVLRASIDVPDAQTHAEMTVQRNQDTTFPASHTIQVQFSSTGAPGIGGIKNLNAIEMREAENQAGYPLAGQGIAVMENVFLIALTQAEASLARNIEMMKGRPFIYLQFQLTDGRRGAMIIEKGVSGQQAFEESFRKWQQ